MNTVEQTPDGWVVRGEVGLGPVRVGQRFTAVQPQTDEQADVDLVVRDVLPEAIRLSGTSRHTLRHGDILLAGDE